MDLTCDTFPADDEVNPKAYEVAIGAFVPGDVAVIFTPDDTHFDIAMTCIERGMHVMVTKPIVQTLEDHQKLAQAAASKGVLVGVEVHKRLDPFYADARDRARLTLGNFQYMYAYHVECPHCLFRAWKKQCTPLAKRNE